jgi:CRP-like cAMP-binding protein
MARTFLAELGADERADLEGTARRRRYGAAVTLLHQGDDPGTVIVLLAGRAKVTSLGAGGREAIVAVRGPGDLIGELSAIDGSARSATVTTLEPAEALLLSRSAFNALLERRPRIALVILRLVAERLRYADAQQAQFVTHDVVGRLAQRLDELADRFGTAHEDGVEIALALSQEELAAWTGASRESVSRGLQLLRSLGIVETGRRRILVRDPTALRRRAG